MDPDPFPPPQVKICGLTDAAQAAAVAALGAAAVGLVFFPKSPRHLRREQALSICRALPESVRRVGVFVDERFESILEMAAFCGLDAVQLHGHEPPEKVERLRREGLLVIKALFIRRPPGLADASAYRPSGFLVECGAGTLPGGNAQTWAWSEARPLADRHPLILAGGLGPENVAQAVEQAQPDAVDLSSGVEAAPGVKDLRKVAALMAAVRQCRMMRRPRTIF